MVLKESLFVIQNPNKMIYHFFVINNSGREDNTM